MAYDQRQGGRDGDRDGRQEERRPRPERMGDRNYRGETDDPDYGSERYGSAPSYGSESGRGPDSTDPESFFSAPGFDAEFAFGPRFDRQDAGSTGTHGVHPVSSPFGRGYGAGYGASAAGFRSSARQYAAMGRLGEADRSPSRGAAHDPHYAEWRSRQIEQFDRDYDDYCRERQSRFDREFGEWRERRGRQRQAIGRVREHMEVVGSDGGHVGTVDATSGDSIVLTRSDPNAGGVHHRIACAWIESVDDKVRLNISAEEATNRWREEGRSQALFERQQGFGSGDTRGNPSPESRDRS